MLITTGEDHFHILNIEKMEFSYLFAMVQDRIPQVQMLEAMPDDQLATQINVPEDITMGKVKESLKDELIFLQNLYKEIKKFK